MADSYQKKEREKKKRKRKKEKLERKQRKKEEGTSPAEFMYVDEMGNLTPPPPEPKEEVKAEDIVIGIPKQEEGESEGSKFEKDGKVKFFDTEKGYGFILDKYTKDSYFVHANDLETEITADDEVTYEVGTGPKGLIAIKVKRKEAAE